MLEVDLVLVGELAVAVDVLFEHAQAVAQHDNLVKERLDGNLLGLEVLVSRAQFHGAPLPLVAQRNRLGRLHVLVEDILYSGDDVFQLNAGATSFRAGLHDLIGFVSLGQFLLAVFLEEDAPGGAGLPENRALTILGVGDACSDSNHVRQVGDRGASSESGLVRK